jgi:hypothetical protein
LPQTSQPIDTDYPILSADLIRGAAAIGRFIGVNERRARHLLAQNIIPHFKEGEILVASARALRAFYAARVDYGGTLVNGTEHAEPAAAPSAAENGAAQERERPRRRRRRQRRRLPLREVNIDA